MLIAAVFDSHYRKEESEVLDLASILELVNVLFDKRKASEAEKNRDRVLVAIYTLGSKGSHSVTSEQLEAQGFTKLQISNAIEMAEYNDWIIDCKSFDGASWLLKPRAIYYVEGLLEAKKS